MMVQGQHRFFFGSWNMVLKLAKYFGSIRICQVHQVDTLFFPSFFESSRSRGPYVLNTSKQQARVSYVFILQDTFSR